MLPLCTSILPLQRHVLVYTEHHWLHTNYLNKIPCAVCLLPLFPSQFKQHLLGLMLYIHGFFALTKCISVHVICNSVVILITCSTLLYTKYQKIKVRTSTCKIYNADETLFFCIIFRSHSIPFIPSIVQVYEPNSSTATSVTFYLLKSHQVQI